MERAGVRRSVSGVGFNARGLVIRVKGLGFRVKGFGRIGWFGVWIDRGFSGRG